MLRFLLAPLQTRKLRTAFCNCVVSSATSVIKYVRCNGRILCARVAPAIHLVVWDSISVRCYFKYENFKNLQTYTVAVFQ
jgi:hypothetical protein